MFPKPSKCYSYLTSSSYTNFPKGRFSFLSEQMKLAPGWSGFQQTSGCWWEDSHQPWPPPFHTTEIHSKCCTKITFPTKSHIPCQVCSLSVAFFSLEIKCGIIFLYYWFPKVTSSYFPNQWSICGIFKDLPTVSFWGHL